MPALFRLKKPIGPNHVVDPGDTARTKTTLAGLGFLEVPEEGVTPWPDAPMIDAVAAFQRKNGLKVDGVINPGGETERAINAAIATGSDLGVIPGTEPTKPRIGVNAPNPAGAGRDNANAIAGPFGELPDPDPAKRKRGVEALDPALSDREHTEVPIDIDVGPPFVPPEPQWPGVEGVDPALGGRGHTHVGIDTHAGPLLPPTEFTAEDRRKSIAQVVPALKAVFETVRDTPLEIARGLVRFGADKLLFLSDVLRVATTAPEGEYFNEWGNDVFDTSETPTYSLFSEREEAALREIFDAWETASANSGAKGSPVFRRLLDMGLSHRDVAKRLLNKGVTRSSAEFVGFGAAGAAAVMGDDQNADGHLEAIGFEDKLVELFSTNLSYSDLVDRARKLTREAKLSDGFVPFLVFAWHLNRLPEVEPPSDAKEHSAKALTKPSVTHFHRVPEPIRCFVGAPRSGGR